MVSTIFASLFANDASPWPDEPLILIAVTRGLELLYHLTSQAFFFSFLSLKYWIRNKLSSWYFRGNHNSWCELPLVCDKR